MMSSDIVAASLSTRDVTFSRLRSGWLFRADRTVRYHFCADPKCLQVRLTASAVAYWRQWADERFGSRSL